MAQPTVVRDPRLTLTARQPGRTLAQIGRVVLFLLGYITLLRVTAIATGMVPPGIGDLTWGALASVSLIGLTWIMRRGRSTVRSAGISAARVRQLLGGGAIGLATHALTLAAIGVLVVPLKVSPTAAAPDALTGVLTVAGFLALACMEELGFRGYPLRTLSAALGTRTALLVVSVLFAASHVLFGWPWQSILLGVLPSGVLFGVAAIVSRGLFMPIGLHAAMNVAQWVAGEKAAPGFFTLALDPALAAHSARFTPFIGAAMPLLVAAALWRWYPGAAPMPDARAEE